MPCDNALLAPMRATTVALARGGLDYWTALIGFHFSHRLGVLLFALLVVLASVYALGWLKALLVAVAAGSVFRSRDARLRRC